MADSAQIQGNAADMKDRAQDEFDRWADSYDRSILHTFLFGPAYLAIMEEIAAWRKIHPGPFRVLDIGCATGELSHILARTPWPVEVVGLDYAPAMTEQAHQKVQREGLGDKATFTTGDSEFLPFADESFDFIACANSFHHYPHQAKVVSLIHQLLRPGGCFQLIDGFPNNAVGFTVFDVIIPKVEGEVYHAPWWVIDKYYRDAGFTNIRRRKFNFWMPLVATCGEKT